ncbi:MAG: hypothetical protein U0527_17045 [Candidatus Eisenbacteria bacterium]
MAWGKSAARTPGSRLSTMVDPTPAASIITPRSARPSWSARPTATAKVRVVDRFTRGAPDVD